MSHSLFDHHKKTDEEKQKVVEGLKAVDGAEEFDDFTLDRFAKARNYDLGKAKTMLTKHISWRNRTFPIAEKEIEEELEMKKFFHSGFDQEGHPVLIFWGSRHKPKRNHHHVTVNAIVHVMEEVHKKYDKEKVVVVVYAGKGASMDKPLIRDFASVLTSNYPEKLHKAIIFPGTTLAHTLWGVVKWFFPHETREKVIIMPTNKQRAYEVFRTLIAAENLHQAFGGELPNDEIPLNHDI